VFVLTVHESGLVLLCYNADSFALQSLTVLSLPDGGYYPAYPSDLILWGTNGIAFNGGGDAVVVLSGGFAPGSTSAASTLKEIARLEVH